MNEFENVFDDLKRSIIHIRLKQRKANSYITIVENCPGNLENITKVMKKKFCCNGTIKNGLIQLSGDHKEAVRKLLIDSEICDADDIILHGI